METKLHKDAKLIDRLGREFVMEHFSITRQTIWDWRKRGIPKMHRKTFDLLKERS